VAVAPGVPVEDGVPVVEGVPLAAGVPDAALTVNGGQSWAHAPVQVGVPPCLSLRNKYRVLP